MILLYLISPACYPPILIARPLSLCNRLLKPNTKTLTPPPPSEAYHRHLFASVWVAARVRDVWEPLFAFVVCAWMAYGAWDNAARHATEAAIFGALLGLSLSVSATWLAFGLRRSGRWRQFPVSFPFAQFSRLFGTIAHAGIVTQWARLLGRSSSTPAFAAVYLLCFFVTLSTSILGPNFIFVVRIVPLAHHCVVVLYDALTAPDDPLQGRGPNRGIEHLVTAALPMLFVYVIAFLVTSPKAELIRRKDIVILARCLLQRDVTLALVTNFLPPVVSRFLQERAAAGESAEVAAWRFDSAAVLQSDIVGFTSLGSRISPEELCRWAGSATGP